MNDVIIRREIRRDQKRKRAMGLFEMYRKGMTLEEIGATQIPPITRERVRQLLSFIGKTKEDGGAYFRALVNAKYRNQKKQGDRIIASLGCLKSDMLAINKGMSRREKGSPSNFYIQQKNNAKHRGIEWKFTFLDWWAVWQESGKWELRGRGGGYCMSRIGDTGPYSRDNVEIKTNSENASESYIKHPYIERFKKRNNCLHHSLK